MLNTIRIGSKVIEPYIFRRRRLGPVHTRLRSRPRWKKIRWVTAGRLVTWRNRTRPNTLKNNMFARWRMKWPRPYRVEHSRPWKGRK